MHGKHKVEELRSRLEEKNRLIEKKTQGTLQAVSERNRITNEFTELKDHMDIKDRKINVLQRKVRICLPALSLISLHDFGIFYFITGGRRKPFFYVLSFRTDIWDYSAFRCGLGRSVIILTNSEDCFCYYYYSFRIFI